MNKKNTNFRRIPFPVSVSMWLWVSKAGNILIWKNRTRISQLISAKRTCFNTSPYKSTLSSFTPLIVLLWLPKWHRVQTNNSEWSRYDLKSRSSFGCCKGRWHFIIVLSYFYSNYGYDRVRSFWLMWIVYGLWSYWISLNRRRSGIAI